MDIPVLIEPIPGVGYRARGVEPFSIVVEGATPEDALSRFKGRLSEKLSNGARIATVPLPNSDHPWAKFAGMFDENDPVVQEWLQIMREQRDADE
jgi:hypothetical protein